MNNSLQRSIIGMFCLLFLSSCSLLGMDSWGAFKITVEVIDKSGVGVPQAMVKTSNDLQKQTNENGQVELTYVSSGLHVVTVSADDKETKQFKITLPRDDQKQVSIVLNDKVVN